MIGTRYENYSERNSELPFTLKIDIERNPYNGSKEKNWHSDPELQLCREGRGSVLLSGEKYDFEKGSIIVINSNELHYTGSEESLSYTCLIIRSSFCKRIGIDCERLRFDRHIESERLRGLMEELCRIYSGEGELREARCMRVLIDILLELAENHVCENYGDRAEYSDFKKTKAAVNFIRDNFGRKFSLDELAGSIYTDKYALCRDFKKYTGQTVMSYANSYRCQRAAEFILEGATVAEAAERCGFDNVSFFIRTFKKHMNALPSSFKKNNSASFI